MIRRTRLPVLAALASAALLAALTIGPSASARSTHAAATPVQGGDLIIARTQDSTKMDATSVFDNESIWVLEQMMETLYTVTPDGKDVKPWLATSYDLSPDKLTYTFHLRHGVLFHTGKEMTSADVKFSLDAARNTKDGWGYIDGAIKSVTAKDKYTVVVKTKFKWAPMVADIALFSNAIVPKGYDGKTKAQFYNAPVGTGPFKWDHWSKGKELKLVKFDKYWQKGKPYLNSVTWTYVGDDNTRLLQLKGNQAQIDEFPGWAQVKPLQNTAGVTMKLFPSTRTDYVLFNQHFKPFQDVHVRRAISYLIDRKALVKAILFGNGTPANSFLPPQVPYYDAETPGLTYNLAKAKEEMAKSSVPNGFTTTFESVAGSLDQNTIGQVIQAAGKPLGIKVNILKKDANAWNVDWQNATYPGMNNSYWTMDIADPDELVSFAVDPSQGAHSFQTFYNSPAAIAAAKAAAREFDPKKRQALYTKVQKIAAQDAFMAFLYYSPFRYAFTNKVHAFQVYPTGNYHMEDVWMDK
jgi:peptide/nickel transport system substrate-binding protein